jgi:hypothetical protein
MKRLKWDFKRAFYNENLKMTYYSEKLKRTFHNEKDNTAFIMKRLKCNIIEILGSLQILDLNSIKLKWFF